MKPHRTRLASIVLATLLMLLLGITTAQTTGGTLRVGQVTDLVNLDPHEIGQSDGAFKWQVYQTLVRLESDLTPTPVLAESWEYSDDALSLTFHLREGVLFHNGRPLTSEDVAFNIRRVQDPETGSKLRTSSLNITSIETPDDHTLVVGFDAPNPTVMDFFHNLWIGAPEMFGDPTAAIGTGPFRFVRWIPGEKVELERFDDYWREGFPYLDGIEIRVLPDQQSLVANLQADAIDFARNVPLTALDTLRADPRLEVLVSDAGSNYYALGFVTTSPPLDNKLVRQALNLTVDRERFVRVFQNGAGQATCVPWPSSSPAYDEAQATSCSYDLDAARALLDEAGYGDGFDLSVEISQEITPDSVRLVQMWQQDLKQLDINLTIEQISANVWKQRKIDATFKQVWADLFGNTNKNPVTPFLQARPFLAGTNPSHFDTEEYRSIIADLSTEIDPAKQKALYHDITALLLDEAFINPVTYQPQIFAYTTDLKGHQLTIQDKNLFEAAYLDR